MNIQNSKSQISLKILIDAQAVMVDCDVAGSSLLAPPLQPSQTASNSASNSPASEINTDRSVMKNLISQLDSPTVDWKFFNDQIRNFLALGSVAAIGTFMYQNSSSILVLIASIFLISLSVLLVLANCFQIMAAAMIVMGVKRKTPSAINQWLIAIFGALLSAAMFYAFSLIYAVSISLSADQLEKLKSIVH